MMEVVVLKEGFVCFTVIESWDNDHTQMLLSVEIRC